jgi:hypothetical protein
MILVFGILSIVISVIGLPFGIAALVMGRRDLKKIESGAMDPEGKGLTQAGWICGIIGTILQGMGLLFCIGYFTLIGVLIAGAAKQQQQMRPANTPAPAPFQQPNNPAPKRGRTQLNGPARPLIDPAAPLAC